MSLRRFAPLALAVLGCQTDIPNDAPPSTIVFAITVPSATDATQAVATPAPRAVLPPSPNDLLLKAATCTAGAADPTCSPLPAGDTRTALASFAAAGGFPSLAPPPAPAGTPFPITIQLIEKTVSGNPTCAPAANASPEFPDIDPATITPESFALVRYDQGTPTQYAFTVPPGTAGYNRATGVLTIFPTQGWQRTPGIGGRYVAALRAGDHGVKTTAGAPVVIAAQTSAFLLSQDADLTKAENQLLLRTCLQEPVLTATVGQLEALRQAYSTSRFWTNNPSTPPGWQPLPSSVLPPGTPALPAALAAIDTVFPHREIATIQTFVIAP